MLFLILGIGAFKPNISTQVGTLYAPGDGRRDRAYSIFYVGISIGALLAPLVCGALAVVVRLALRLRGGGRRHADQPRRSISPGSARCRRTICLAPAKRERIPLDPHERRNVLALLGICALVTLFWAAFDQQGNTIVLWAEDFTDRTVNLFGWSGEIPTPWFLALNPLMIFVLTPLLVRIWTLQARRRREPSALRKMAFGCLCLAAAYLVMVAGAGSAAGKASALWLAGYFVLATLGELCLAPIGLALIVTMAPTRIRSMMMGVWFAATLPADILGGYLGGFWSSMAKDRFFLLMAAIAAVAGASLWVASHVLRPMLGGPLNASRDRSA